MKYRIVKKADGYTVEERTFLVWWAVTNNFGISLIFPDQEKAEAALDAYIKTKTPPVVVKEIEG